MNDVRRAILWKYFDKKKKIVDLCLLPPCQVNLIYHCHRSNYVAYLFRHAEEINIDLESPTLHRWTEDMGMKWADECIPSDIAEQLFSSEIEDSNELVKNQQEIECDNEESDIEDDEYQYDSDIE